MNTALTRFGSLVQMSLAVGCMCILLTSVTQAAILRVDPASPNNGPGEEEDWSDAFHTIQSAVGASSSGDEIHVAGGSVSSPNVYKPVSGNLGNTINLADGVSIQGGYAGYGASDPDARDIDVYVTVLSGDHGNDDPTDYSNNAYTVVFIPNGVQPPPNQGPGNSFADRANLDGFTITAARRSGVRTQLTNFPANASAIIRNCKIHNNVAEFVSGMGGYDGHGGGVRVETGDELVLRQCEIYENTAEVHGGGMYLSGDTILLNCNIHDNTAAQRGGGVKSNLVDLTVVSTTFESNEAISAGGALYCDSDGRTVKLINSLFIGNFVNGNFLSCRRVV